ncbi:MAG: hypothetical protein DRJ38_09585 [Thermoprotei archaeon]|nr:MAG: hypothetical protein DRJ38_09585 [Thermoprotei archaeon]
MVNPWLSLAGFGMTAIGFAALLYWSKYKKIRPLFYGIGLLAWFLAILIKVVLDFTLTSSILNLAPREHRVLAACLYYGLRTGLFEAGILYLFLLKLKIKRISFEDAVGIGIAYGAIEAILTGFSNIVNILMFYFVPELIEQIPEAQREIIVSSLNLETIVIFAPIIERASALIIHITSAILVVLALKYGLKYLLAAIAYKSLVDGIIPLLQSLLANPSVYNYYITEIPFIVIAILSIIVLGKLKDKLIQNIVSNK